MDESKMKFPSNLNYDGKIVGEMDPRLMSAILKTKFGIVRVFHEWNKHANE